MSLDSQIESSPTPTETTAPAAHPAYSDHPNQHPNLLIGSLHLLAWLLVHPAAWRHHLQRIDPALAADFTLTTLTRSQWRNPAIRRFLVQCYLVLPLLTGLLLAIVFWLGNVPNEQLLPTTLHFITRFISLSLFLGAVVSVASGVVSGLAATLLLGIIGSFMSGQGVNVWLINPAIGLSLGLAGSINSHFHSHQKENTAARQIGGVVIGVIIGLTMVLMRHGVTALGEFGGLSNALAYSLARSLLVLTSFGLAIGWQRGWRAGLLSALTTGVFYSLILGVTDSSAPDTLRGISSGALFGISLIAMFALPYILANYVAGFWAGAWAGSLASYGRHIYFAAGGREGNPNWAVMPIGFVGVILGLTVARWRPWLFYPLEAGWNRLLYQADKRRPHHRPSLLRWNTAFWDEGQYLPLHGLDDHLLLALERNPPDGQAALEYLSGSQQRWAARAVQIELDARQLEDCAGLMAIRAFPRNLALNESSNSQLAALLRNFSRISQDVDAALNQATAYNQQQALQAVEQRLDIMLRELTRSPETYAVRFRPSASRWRQIVADRIQELAVTSEALQEISSPYVIGMPLMAQQEVFVGRADVSFEIEQFLLDQVSPPLLLYGQRRMGKTSLLNNLGKLLPSNILPLFVDLQGPASWATNHSGFLYHIVQAMRTSAQRQRGVSLPNLDREELLTDPFIQFDAWLNTVEAMLPAQALQTILLTLDEFEALDDALNQGRFSEQAILGLLRHIIQHRTRIKILLAGSHTLEEFQHWASYLINVRLIHLSYLNEKEARQLIEQPIQDFALRYEPDASQRVLELTRGHPFLVQLLCSEIVDLKNKQPVEKRRFAEPVDVNAAIEQALTHGNLYFADIKQNRVDTAGLAVLNCLAALEEGATLSYQTLVDQLDLSDTATLDQTLAALTQQELIEKIDGSYRFQVDLIRRWFAQNS